MKLFFSYFFIMCVSSITGFFGLHMLFSGSAARATKPSVVVSNSVLVPSLRTAPPTMRRPSQTSNTTVATSAFQSVSGSGRVRVQIANDSATRIRKIDGIAESLANVVREEEASLLAKGVRSISLRPVYGDRLYVEILAYNSKSKLIGSFLLRERQARGASLRLALSEMWYDTASEDTISGKLVVKAEVAGDARAYVNGFPLSRMNQGNEYVFRFRIPGHQDLDRVTLAITSFDRPLISSTLARNEFHRTHRWTLPSKNASENQLAVK